MLKQIVDTQRGACPVALCRDPLAVFLEQIDNPGCCFECLIGSIRNTGKEEIEPGFPCPVLAHLLKQAVIVSAMRFKVKAQIEVMWWTAPPLSFVAKCGRFETLT